MTRSPAVVRGLCRSSLGGRGERLRAAIETIESRLLLCAAHVSAPGPLAFPSSASPSPTAAAVAPPTVIAVTPNGVGSQRSVVRSLAVRFSGPVAGSLTDTDLTLWNATTAAFVDTAGSAVGYDPTTDTANWTFAALPGGRLPDGNYRVTVRSLDVYADGTGDPLDGDADGVGGDDAHATFHAHFGDADGDRDVDNADLFLFRGSYGRSAGDPAYRSYFDWDNDGDADNADLFQLRRTYGRQLPTPGGNTPPAAPVINEPGADGALVSAQDLHMQVEEGFVDPNVGQARARSDFEVWTRGPTPRRVWAGLNQTAFDSMTHVHFGDGTFEGPQAGQRRLAADTDYLLRARTYDDSGDPGTRASNWDVRLFHTRPDAQPTAPGWVARQPGYLVEEVPFTFPAGEQGWRLPTNIAFVPDAVRGHRASDPLFYVMELYGSVRVVSNDLTVRTYATGLLNYNPVGPISGVGENGSTGLVVDPTTGDVFATMLYDDPADASANTFPKVTRFTSADGGTTAVDSDPTAAGTQGTDILKMPGEAMRQSHIVSNVSFGPDDKLYVHVGDGLEVATGQNDFRFKGKILRMNRDGSPAAGNNPLSDLGVDRGNDGLPDAEDYWYAKGLRNPFGGAWRDAAGGRPAQHYTVENGPSRDRFSLLVQNRNYLYDGSDASMANFNIAHAPAGAFENGAPDWDPAPAPVNVAFVQAGTFNGSGFPAAKLGHAFVTLSGPTHASGPGASKAIQEWVLNDDGTRRASAAGEPPNPRNLIEYQGPGYSTAAGLAAGPDGLYFTTLYPDADPNGTAVGAKVLRVVYAGAASFDVAPGSGPAAPLAVRFTDTSDVAGAAAWAWDFGDGATSAERSPAHTYAAEGLYTVRLTVTGARGPVVVQRDNAVRVGTAAVPLKVNFQSDGAPVPPGYLADTGLAYGDRGNGWAYGWYDAAAAAPTSHPGDARDRNSPAAPDQRYDTLIHMVTPGTSTGYVWQAGVPDGQYSVRLVMGDPGSADSVNNLVLEGAPLADPDGPDGFDVFAATVTVSDGKLTLAPGAAAGTYPKACFIEVTPVSSPADRTNEAGGTASARAAISADAGAAKAFDDAAATAWLDNAGTPTPAAPSWLQYRFANDAAVVVRQYAVTSADADAARDPRDWRLLGSNNGTAWSALDARTAQAFAGRFERRLFSVAAPGAFKYYRLEVAANGGSAEGMTQLAELELIG